MIVEDVVEHDDGSCTLQVELTDEEVRFLISYAIKDILEREVDRMEKENAGG